MLALKRPGADGTRQLLFEPLTLLEKLAALIPRPRINLVIPKIRGLIPRRAPYRNSRTCGGVMWVDTCISVPTLGLLTTPSFNAVFHYPERLQPMLDEAVVRDQELGVGGDRTVGFEFRTKQGFTYKLNLNNMVVEFDYRPTETRVPGALPVSKMPPLRKFTALVDETVEHMARILSLVSTPSHSPKVVRFGLVAKSRLERSKAPPGITDMIKTHGSFFRGELIKTQAMFLVNVESTAKYQDRCHHTYAFDETEKPDDLTVLLDWQRVFPEPITLPTSVNPLREMKDAALAYFERVGEGGLKDA